MTQQDKEIRQFQINWVRYGMDIYIYIQNKASHSQILQTILESIIINNHRIKASYTYEMYKHHIHFKKCEPFGISQGILSIPLNKVPQFSLKSCIVACPVLKCRYASRRCITETIFKCPTGKVMAQEYRTCNGGVLDAYIIILYTDTGPFLEVLVLHRSD